MNKHQDYLIKNLIDNHIKNYDENIKNILDHVDEENDINIDENINIEDYELAEEEVELMPYISLLNIYTCYFKKLFVRNKDSTMFDNIDYTKVDSTNKCLEFLYEEIYKFNKSDDQDKDVLFDPDDDNIKIDQCDELYSLYIGNEPKYVCKYLLPLFKFIGETYKNWAEIDWSIIPLKS